MLLQVKRPTLWLGAVVHGKALDGTLARVRNRQRPKPLVWDEFARDVPLVANTTVALCCVGLLSLMAVRFGRKLHTLARLEPQQFRLRRSQASRLAAALRASAR
jgi:hypothetical protein